MSSSQYSCICMGKYCGAIDVSPSVAENLNTLSQNNPHYYSVLTADTVNNNTATMPITATVGGETLDVIKNIYPSEYGQGMYHKNGGWICVNSNNNHILDLVASSMKSHM